MVFATSDSCSTLVSLDQNGKSLGVHHGAAQPRLAPEEEEVAYERSELLLPEDVDAWGDHDACATMDARRPCLYLPTDESKAIDVHLRSIPEVVERVDELLANPPVLLCASSQERILYVAQGELGHATRSQCDVIVSDRATTCHIVAVRSTTTSNTTEPLVSLTHVDATAYDDCLRGMINEHKLHHKAAAFHQSDDDDEEEKKQEDSWHGSDDDMIRMELHMVGGFQDEKESSREISNHLLRLFSRIASEEVSQVRMTLKTCAISSLNDTGHAAPIGRGLGMDLRTGHVFLAKVDSSALGPCPELRAVRLWAGHGGRTLSVIHNSHNQELVIRPFYFEAPKEVEILLRLEDRVLLEYTSTSPRVEEDDFCDSLRRALRYMLQCSSRGIFEANQPVYCQRQGSSNIWERV